ncbi:MAG: HEAT repeat domain-containing protein [Longimicrobiales bacterium]
MPDLATFVAALSVRDGALWVLALSVAALVALSFLFAMYTMLLRAGHEIREARWRRLTARWQEPLLQALMDPEAEAGIHRLVGPRERLHFVQFALEYARRVIGAERETLQRLARPYLAPLVPRTLHRHQEVRTRAVQTLGALGLPEHADAVTAALDDPSPLVAMVAATALARRDDARYAEAILRRLYRFDTWSPNFLAAMLAGMGPGGAEALREVMADPTEPARVRAIAARALAELPDLQAGPAAAAVVEIEEDPDLLASALRLLTQVGFPEHARYIRVRCASPDAAVRSTALRALGALGQEGDMPRLIGAMSDPSPWVAISAARGIHDAGGEQLLRDLAESEHPRAVVARQVLAEHGS